MKQIFILLSFLGWCLFTVSCTNNDIDNQDTAEPVKPGIYYVDVNFTTKQGTTTKGIDEKDINFDKNYDYNYIYLHKISDNDGETDDYIEFPVYACDECDENEKGIRYRICISDDGSAVITPIDAEGEHVDGQQLTLGKDDKCYFSSWDKDEWKLDTNQQSQTTVSENNDSYFFYRNKENNKEIYRSEDDYGISDLQSPEKDLTIVRACAGFDLVGLFYDENGWMEDEFVGGGYGEYNIDKEKFKNIMGSYPDEWYIKIYIGGKSFPNQYNIENRQSEGSNNGYYSSGDASKFVEEDIDTQYYLQFSPNLYKETKGTYNGYGYFTKNSSESSGPGNHLFTPVTGEEVEVHILVKHWTGEDEPTAEWLNSDYGALQTTVNLTGNSNPENNFFYITGLLMDLTQFKAAWDDSGGDNWTPESASAVSTKSPSGATVREFTLKDAKVICDVY